MDIMSFLLGKKAGGGGGSTPTSQTKSVTITQNGATTVTPDTGVDYLSSVNITTNVSGGGDDLKKVIDKSITSLDIPSGTTKVGQSIFYYCSNLTSVTIPSSVTTIENSGFSFSGLTSISIPNSVTTIGKNVFYGCGE